MIVPNERDTTCIILEKTAYCSEFHLNIAFFSHFFDWKLFWDTEHEMLYQDERPLAWVQKQKNLFILKDQQVSNESVNAIMKQSSK